jgi:putative DeoR family transcriptional regulator (stage III sporulation protein D)
MKAADYKLSMYDKTLRMARVLIETRYTFKLLAKQFNCSESAARRLIREVLPELNPELANQCFDIVDYHKAIAHLRGGEGNKIKHKEGKQ